MFSAAHTLASTSSEHSFDTLKAMLLKSGMYLLVYQQVVFRPLSV